MDSVLNWWDGVELWLSGLGFVAQTLLVMPVTLALAYGIAVLLDGLLGYGSGAVDLIARRRGRDEPAPAEVR